MKKEREKERNSLSSMKTGWVLHANELKICVVGVLVPENYSFLS
jgi:hypothetical protein